MGLLNLLGLDDLADSVSDLTSDIQGLKDDIIESVVGPGEELKNTVTEISESIKQKPTK
jgi:hypothetical protein